MTNNGNGHGGTTSAMPAGVADLAAELAEERARNALTTDHDLTEWSEARRIKARRQALAAELAAERRDLATAAALAKADARDARWHRKARADRRRVASPDAQLASLYRAAEWSSRALVAVVALGMIWAGVNVQRNLVPSGNMYDPLYWLSYGIEAMISVPIIVVMVLATKAARRGKEIDRRRVVVFELALLGMTLALNVGPHLKGGDWATAAKYGIAPVMVGVVIGLHGWVAGRYGELIADADDDLAEAIAGDQAEATKVTAERVLVQVPTLHPAPTAPVALHSVQAPPVEALHHTGTEVAGQWSDWLDQGATAAPVQAGPAPVQGGADVPVQAPAPAPAPAPVAPVAADIVEHRAPVTSTEADHSAEGGPVQGPAAPVAGPVGPVRPIPVTAEAVQVDGDGAGEHPAPVQAGAGAPDPVAPAPVQAPTAEVAPATDPVQVGDDDDTAAEGAEAVDVVEIELAALAVEVQGRGPGSKMDTAAVMDVIRAADGGDKVNAIHVRTGLSAATINKILRAADEVRATWSAPAARVIALHKP